MSFAFSFSGDDIDEDDQQMGTKNVPSSLAETAPAPSSAFPVSGKPLLPATRHDLKQMLSALPSKIAYGTLDVRLDSGDLVQLPRRELWDVRVQLMAEEESGGEGAAGLGSHDVKTGVYEGGFKSWESSVDLVKVLEQSKTFLASQDEAPCVIELGCGTALPSLALFHWATSVKTGASPRPLSIILADYNSAVLQLVTLPNLILSWALQQAVGSSLLTEAFASVEGELELSPEVIQAFENFLTTQKVNLQFISGGWSPDFVDLVIAATQPSQSTDTKPRMVILGAETIYSPFALHSFTETIFSLMKHSQSTGNTAEVFAAAKKLYFGVGGSLDDFVVKSQELGAVVEQLREETEGVRRGVVKCYLKPRGPRLC
ncbi:histidine protein methyltransferase 1 [Seiridium cupressi]